jgi:GMP synthase-like glutamine amidotransferase
MFLAIINHPVERLGNIKDILNEKGYDVKEKLALEIKGNEEFDGLIIMGGPMSVYENDKYPFLNLEVGLIRKALQEGKPVLGICLGAQLLSASLGGEVRKGAFGEEIGIYRVRLLEEFREILGEEIEVFQWHGDTFTLPQGSKLLAYNEKYFQAFRIGSALGIQFHVEVDSRMIREWIDAYGGDKAIVSKVREKEEIFRIISEKIISHWLTLPNTSKS